MRTNKRILSQFQRDVLNRFYLYLKSKRYSISTVKTYTFLVADFIEFVGDKPLHTITKDEIDSYLMTDFVPKQYSISTQRQLISALKLFKTMNPELGYDSLELTRPKRSKKLPIVLSKMEIINLIVSTKNLKHRIMIAMLYSCGLRISELLQLKLSDVNLERKQVFVNLGKGRKDRYIVLSESMIPLIQNYLFTYAPNFYFIENNQGKQYSASSVRKFLKKSCKLANITKPVTPHTLRHSYATHLLENGVNLRHIQMLLGHANPETTMSYTHVTKRDVLNVKSPLDYIIEDMKTMGDIHTKKVSISRNITG